MTPDPGYTIQHYLVTLVPRVFPCIPVYPRCRARLAEGGGVWGGGPTPHTPRPSPGVHPWNTRNTRNTREYREYWEYGLSTPPAR